LQKIAIREHNKPLFLAEIESPKLIYYATVFFRWTGTKLSPSVVN